MASFTGRNAGGGACLLKEQRYPVVAHYVETKTGVSSGLPPALLTWCPSPFAVGSLAMIGNTKPVPALKLA